MGKIHYIKRFGTDKGERYAITTCGLSSMDKELVLVTANKEKITCLRCKSYLKSLDENTSRRVIIP